jgi:hypothetical protein
MLSLSDEVVYNLKKNNKLIGSWFYTPKRKDNN